jgi:hypothetical protein
LLKFFSYGIFMRPNLQHLLFGFNINTEKFCSPAL